MRDFAFKIDLVAMVRVRASDEKAARKIVPTVLRAPDTTELRLANENNTGQGQIATVTDVDFSIASIKPSQ
jgi:hypothetical protein